MNSKMSNDSQLHKNGAGPGAVPKYGPLTDL